ncbi:MAG: hypothetical protein WBF71_16360, partial [Microthrixaceae bacterium]
RMVNRAVMAHKAQTGTYPASVDELGPYLEHAASLAQNFQVEVTDNSIRVHGINDCVATSSGETTIPAAAPNSLAPPEPSVEMMAAASTVLDLHPEAEDQYCANFVSAISTPAELIRSIEAIPESARRDALNSLAFSDNLPPGAAGWTWPQFVDWSLALWTECRNRG